MSTATSMTNRPFSWRWALFSMVVFIVAELLLGGLVGNLVAGRFQSISLAFVLQAILNLASYFVGGFVVGLVSPGVRVLEPALGAFASVALMLVLTLFTPLSFLRFSLTKLIIGGGIAFVLALSGAKLGERVAGNRVD